MQERYALINSPSPAGTASPGNRHNHHVVLTRQAFNWADAAVERPPGKLVATDAARCSTSSRRPHASPTTMGLCVMKLDVAMPYPAHQQPALERTRPWLPVRPTASSTLGQVCQRVSRRSRIWCRVPAIAPSTRPPPQDRLRRRGSGRELGRAGYADAGAPLTTGQSLPHQPPKSSPRCSQTYSRRSQLISQWRDRPPSEDTPSQLGATIGTAERISDKQSPHTVVSAPMKTR